MKTVKVDQRSWHYWLAGKGGFDSWEEQNLCSYVRCALGGLLAVSFAIFLVVLVSACVGDMLAWVIAGVINGFVMASSLTVFALGGITVVVVTLLCKGLSDVAGDIEFVADAYSGLRDKICYQLEVK